MRFDNRLAACVYGLRPERWPELAPESLVLKRSEVGRDCNTKRILGPLCEGSVVDRSDEIQALAPDGSDDTFAKGICGSGSFLR